VVDLRGAVLRGLRQLATHWLILELGKLAWCLECVATAVDPVFAHLDSVCVDRGMKV
jgi:hypothetical protein